MKRLLAFVVVASAALVLATVAGRGVLAADQKGEPPAMFGLTPARNMVSNETGLPSSWDVATGKNVKWRQKLGSQTYSGPVVHGGQVYVGTNNEGGRRPGADGDKGVVMAFNAADGKFLWQSTNDKLPAGRVNDWPLQGICSTPYVDDDRVYFTSNRGEIVAVDPKGFRDGKNDGVKDEKLTTEIDADVLWHFDMIGELDVFPHNLAASSPVIIGDILYATTGNGVDEGHINIPSPEAPSFIALDKNTGKLIWQSNLPGEHIFHGTWSNAAYGTAGGRDQIVFPGGDGWVYSFEPKTGKMIWKFNANPKGAHYELGGGGTANEIIASPVFFEGMVYVGVGQDPEHGEAPGHFYAIDASKTGDITESGKVWHWGDTNFNRTLSTAAIKDGLLYISDLSGFLYCLDAKTGKHHWTHDTFAAIWGSPMVADGKIYLGDEDGDVVVLATGTTKKVIGEYNMGGAVYTTPVAKDGVLYIAARSELFAIAAK
jgi:outer membrane protein assembly factor BamB